MENTDKTRFVLADDLTENRQLRMERMFAQAAGEEDISRRDECIKHFDLGGNRHQAIVYPEPVHFRHSASEPWQEIDNTLEAAIDRHGRSVLRNRANDVCIEFPQQTDSDNVASITENGRTFAWRFETPVQTVSAAVRSGAELRQAELLQRAAELTTTQAGQIDVTALGLKTGASTADIASALESAFEHRMRPAQMNAESRYANIFPGVSLRYELQGRSLKEDILLEKREALQYVIIRLPDTYDYEATDSGELRILDKVTGELCFKMHVPVIYDAEGNTTYGNIRLTSCADHVRLEYIIDDAFLDNAVYPITIDPLITAGSSRTAIEDTYVKKGATEGRNGQDYLHIGNSATNKHAALIRFNKIPSLRSSDTVISAQLRLQQYQAASSRYFTAHEILKPWDDETAIWTDFFDSNDNKLHDAIAEDVIDCTHGDNTEHNIIEVDVTDLFRKWCRRDPNSPETDTNHGVALCHPQNLTNISHTVVYSSTKSGSGYWPILYVNYISHAGIEDWWQYEQMSAGRAGTVYADLFNGNMILAHADVAMTGNRMPVSISHFYNSCLSNLNPYGCGYGWKTSAHQKVEKRKIGDTNYYVWMDGDGTEHFFKVTSRTPYNDEEGMGLKMTYNDSDSANRTITITDKSHNKMVFKRTSDALAWLVEVKDATNKNSIGYAYVDGKMAEGRLASVTDPVGRAITFNYVSGSDADSVLLERINYPGPANENRYVKFSYENDRLVGVAYSDLLTNDAGNTWHTLYQYDASPSNILTQARNFDNTAVNIGFEPTSVFNSIRYEDESSNNTDQMRRVTSLESVALNASGGISRYGAKLEMDYQNMSTVVNSLDNTGGKKLYYQFNDNGNVICVRDELGFASFTNFDSGIANKPSEQSRLRRAVTNLLLNPDYTANWETMPSNMITVIADESVRCLGLRTMKFASTQATGTVMAMCRQTLCLEPNTRYTFSAYVKTENLSGTGAYLTALRASDGVIVDSSIQLTGTTQTANDDMPTDGWERIHLQFQTGANAENYYLCQNMDGSGTAYFGCPQLEAGDSVSPVSLVSNGNFAYTAADDNGRIQAVDWTMRANNPNDANTGVFTTAMPERIAMPPALSGNYVQTEGIPNKDTGFYQTLNCSGAKDDVFVLGGWANAHSIPRATSVERGFGISVRFFNKNDWSAPVFYAFNSEWVGWQFASWALIAPSAYTKIELSLAYNHNCDYARFTNIFLHREQFGRSFAYDANKNITSTGTLSGQKSNITYDNADNISKYVQPGRKNETANQHVFYYGSDTAAQKKHQLLRSRTPMGQTDRYSYDDYGNQTSARRVDKQAYSVSDAAEKNYAFIRTETGYDANNNYATTSKDARGNTVVREIEPNSGRLLKVTDPENQAVNYEYDESDRVTRVATSAGSKTYCNQYTYENDRIKTVAHNTDTDEPDVVYRFNYDELGRKISVEVSGSNGQAQTLSNNVYSDDRSGLLEEVQYGNGGKVKYSYDGFDRLTGVSYDADTAPRYEYDYGANGEAAVVYDHNLNRTLRTEYDLADRPCGTEMVETKSNGQRTRIHTTRLKYDKYSNLEQFTERTGNQTHTSTYTYDTDNRTTEIRYDYTEPEGEGTEAAPCHKVTYAYDALGRIEKRIASVGDHSYETSYAFEAGASNSYGSGATTPLVKTITQGTGENAMNFEYAYDNRGNIISEKRNGLTTTYAYDALGQLIRVDDPHENATWVYSYDRGGNILSKAKYAYTTGALGTAVETIPYTYGDANWKDKLTAYNGVPITYDAIGNPLNDGTRTYTWSAGRQLRHISILTGEAHGFRANNGVHEGSNTLLRIVYDEASSKLKVKLLRDGREITDKCAASAFVWTKNGAAAGTGREIAVTETEVNGDAQFGCAYTETQGVYGTVSVDNNLVASHDPAATDACHVFTLENGMLKVEAPNNAGSSADYELNDGALSINPGFTGTIAAAYEFTTTPTREIEFKYDHNGLRTQKKVVENGITTTYDYTLHGKLITHMTKRNVEADNSETIQNLHFFYDAQSKPAFVEYNGTMYRYVHNLQGDIVGIIDNSGNLVVEYKYDAWGKPLSITGTLKTTLGEYNPFRYRGYVWDEETRLYYLRSRYYNPTISRFICEDTCVISAQKVGGINMFAYCVNRPILGYDPMGKRYIDALSVQHEIKKQRELALEYTKQTRPQKASQSVVKEIDRYLSNRNFDRLTDVDKVQ